MRRRDKVVLAISGILLCSSNTFSQEEILFRDAFPLPDIINSSAEEIQPVFDKDSSHLYFVRANHEGNIGFEKNPLDQDIWVAEHDKEGNWFNVRNLGGLNNDENNGIFGVSADGNTIYLLNAYIKRKKKALHRGVSIANKKGDGWEHKPKTLPIDDFELHGDHYSFHITDSEDILIISDAGENTLGQEDLYVSIKDDKGTWQKPIHLGNQVNSPGYEISPFLSQNKDTLYFSSDGMGGEGDADIFYSVRLDETWQNWTTPKNLGRKINSADFDAYFIRSGNTCYFTSNREGNNQIYRTHVYIPPPPPIYFAILDYTHPTTVDGTDGTITINNLEPEFTYDRFVYYLGEDSTVIEKMITNTEGEYKINGLPEGDYDGFKVYFSEYTATASDVVPLRDPEVAIVETPVPTGFEDRVYFDLNSSYMNRNGKIKLDELVPKIKAYGSYKVEIIAHTDKRASDTYNKWLSERRMVRVKDYLVSKGINATSISGSYEGENNPVHDCEDCPEDKHQENRRATIKVTKL